MARLQIKSSELVAAGFSPNFPVLVYPDEPVMLYLVIAEAAMPELCPTAPLPDQMN